MESATIQATKRGQLGTRPARRLRAEGLIPAVLYGHGRDPVHLAVSVKKVEHLVTSGIHMVDLDIGGTLETALIKEIQFDAMGSHLIHVDLTRVAMDEEVTVSVSIELHGLAKGAASGGTVDHAIQDIDVRCLPHAIPERIRLEIADLDIGDVIHVRDIAPPPGVEFMHDPDTPVVTVHPPIAAPAEAEEVEVPEEPEVIGDRGEPQKAATDEGKRE